MKEGGWWIQTLIQTYLSSLELFNTGLSLYKTLTYILSCIKNNLGLQKISLF